MLVPVIERSDSFALVIPAVPTLRDASACPANEPSLHTSAGQPPAESAGQPMLGQEEDGSEPVAASIQQRAPTWVGQSECRQSCVLMAMGC